MCGSACTATYLHNFAVSAAFQAGSSADVLDLTADDSSTESCTICLEDVPQQEMHVIGGCLHRFCLSCLQSHTQAKLKEKVYPVSCPHPNCSTGISNRECEMVLRSSQDRQLLAEVT